MSKVFSSKLSNISSSDKKQAHKRCPHLLKQPIVHFSTFFDEKEKGQGLYIIAYQDRNIQFGQNKGDTMALKGQVPIDKKGGQGRILGSYYDPFTGYVYLYDENSFIYKFDYRNFVMQEKFEIFMNLEGLKILKMFSWVENQQSFLFIFHQKGIKVISNTNSAPKSFEISAQIWKVEVLEVQKLSKNFKEFCQNQSNEVILCCLILADMRFPLILTRFHLLEMIKNKDDDKILSNSVALRQKFYVDQQERLDFLDPVNKDTFTCIVISKKYLILGDGTGNINMFTYIYNKTEVFLQLQKTIRQGNNIQDLDLDHHSHVLAVSTNVKVMFINIDQVKKTGQSLTQKENKNLNVLRWTKMGRLFLADVSNERIGSLYLLLSELPIESQEK